LSRYVWRFTLGSPFTWATFGGADADDAVAYLTLLLVTA